MLLEQEVGILWSPSNKKRLEQFGYNYTKTGDVVMIKPQHLVKTSKIKVKVKCDYCGKIIEKIYENYILERSKFPKDTCYDCRYKKEEDILHQKQINGKLTKNDRRYYFFKENRLKEVNNYIKKYKTLDGISYKKDGTRLCNNLADYGDDIYNLTVELGYDLQEITTIKPSWYYENFDIFKENINKLIDKYGFFPSSQQIVGELNMSYNIISYHGGIQKIREMMEYEDKKYLDNNGFYNSSFYETIVANYLIAQGLKDKYKRERNPFPEYEGNYRSDFAFYLENDTEIHCEVWGLSDERHEKYNEVRRIKEKLYKKYSIDLISIEPSIFNKKTYKEIDESLYNIFKNYLNLKFKTVSQEKLIPSSLLTDEELLFEIMKYSNNDDYLPTTEQLRGKVTGYYNEVMKRYNTYQDFGNKFNKKVKFASNGYWTQEKIFEVFDYMILNYGKILNRTECKNDERLRKFSYVIQSPNYGGLITNKLDYFKYLINQNKNIPEIEFQFIYDIARKNSLDYSGSIDDAKSIKAQEILYLLKNKGKLDRKYHDFIRKDYGQEDELLNLVFDVFMYMIDNYGEILSENQFKKLKKTDTKLNEINIYKRIQRSGKYNLKEVKDMFYDYLESTQQPA